MGAGWIEGTFSLDTVAMIERNNYFDAPDLVVSFRELPDADNRGLTGPSEPAYVLGMDGNQSGNTGNKSDPLVTPVKGIMYADTGGWGGYTTGLGMHAAAGTRELHNFCERWGPISVVILSINIRAAILMCERRSLPQWICRRETTPDTTDVRSMKRWKVINFRPRQLNRASASAARCPRPR